MALTTVDSHPNSCFPEANRSKPNIFSNSVTFERFPTSQQDIVGSFFWVVCLEMLFLLAMNHMLFTMNHYS